MHLHFGFLALQASPDEYHTWLLSGNFERNFSILIIFFNVHGYLFLFRLTCLSDILYYLMEPKKQALDQQRNCQGFKAFKKYSLVIMSSITGMEISEENLILCRRKFTNKRHMYIDLIKTERVVLTKSNVRLKK